MSDLRRRDLAFGITFRYLNLNELRNVALVCRTWLHYAREERFIRGPVGTVVFKRNNVISPSWYKEKREIILEYNRRPSINFFFTNERPSRIRNCFCKVLPLKSYSISVEGNYMSFDRRDSFLGCLLFPRTSKTKVATFTFTKVLYTNELYCQEIRCNCSYDVGLVRFLKDRIDLFLVDDIIPNVMIVFSKRSNYTKCQNILEVFTDWFRSKNVIIWGGLVETILVCQIVSNSILCNMDSECVCIFINGPTMGIWSEMLSIDCTTRVKITERFEALKQRIIFKSYSVAFIYVNRYRLRRIEGLDTDIFKEIFPNTTIFSMFGVSLFYGTSFPDLEEHFRIRTLDCEYGIATVVVITY